ncbi:MAG: hypothetical protein QM778_01570 [Myxococcales bacterium]
MSSPRIKGLARVRRDAFVASHPARFLSRGAEEALFRSAEVLSEGSQRVLAGGEQRYFGSTMITFDLARLAEHWRGSFEADEVARLVEGSVRMRLRATRMACAEVARRVTERPLGSAIVETRVRVAGNTLQMDVDLEVGVGVCSPARRAP